jgi:hypothetical protein
MEPIKTCRGCHITWNAENIIEENILIDASIEVQQGG